MLFFWFLAVVPWATAYDGPTSITDNLNTMIERGQAGVYTGGKGVLVRDIEDGLQSSKSMGVPATFWSNDIFAVSQMYPDRVDLDIVGVTDIYDYASVGVVIGSAMSNLFYDFDNIQTGTWGWGVFYAHDSNSVDIRCRWLGSDQIYDCPGGYIPWGGTYTSDSTKMGTGGYTVGNPDANAAWGGGAGCHFDYVDHTIDQINAYDAGGQNLVQDQDCQCNYFFSGNWADWVSLFATKNGDMSTHSLHADQAICWVNNIYDMINLQNWLFWNYVAGLIATSGSVFSGTAPREYMGWNEVPVDRITVGTATNWDAFLIKLPANVCGNGGGDDYIDCLDHTKKCRLEERIIDYVKAGSLVTGLDHAIKRPGSYTVVAREWQDASGNWFRWFFCEDWTSPKQSYTLTYIQKVPTNQYGSCYMDH